MKTKKKTKLWYWQERARNEVCTCEKCGSTNNITVDHIIPVMILEPLILDAPKERYEMLYNWEENFQFLCRYCNKQKGHKLDIRNPKTIPLLDEFIKILKTL